MRFTFHRLACLAAVPALLAGAGAAQAQSLRPQTLQPALLRPMNPFSNPLRPLPGPLNRTYPFANQPITLKYQFPNGPQVSVYPLSPGFVAHQQRLFMRQQALDVALLRTVAPPVPYAGGYSPYMAGGYGGGYSPYMSGGYGGGYSPYTSGGGYGGGYSAGGGGYSGGGGGSPFAGNYTPGSSIPPAAVSNGTAGGGYGGTGGHGGDPYAGDYGKKSDTAPVAKREPTKDPAGKLLSALGVPNDDGKLTWPLGLRVLLPQSKCEEYQDRIETLLQTAAEQQQNGRVNANLLDEAAGAVEGLQGMLKTRQSNMMPETYGAAEQYLGKLRHAIKMLRPA